MKSLPWLAFVLFLMATAYPQERLGKHTVAEWRTIIDTTWGPGESTQTKLQIFDLFWNAVDQQYAGFQGIEDKWQEMKAYRDTVALGVSRGRFAGICGHLVASLQDGHVFMSDVGVASTPLQAGAPLLYPLGIDMPSFNWGVTSHFGAALTPLPDSTSLVLTAVANHPLGLVPGDVVLGYDGKLWNHLYKALLKAQFPIACYFAVMSGTDRASTHQWLQAVGMNWHLFDTIDIVKNGTGDTIHLPTQLLSTPMPGIHATEQIPVDGVPFPDVAAGRHVSWGYISGTKIGYIYVYGWSPVVEGDFVAAVNAMMADTSSCGLIIDTRLNEGSTPGWESGFRRLFNQDVIPMGTLVRSTPSNHLLMNEAGPAFPLAGTDRQEYDRPLAVLCGPGAISGGDYAVQFLRLHPMVRTFGLPTNGSFGHPEPIAGLPSGWMGKVTVDVRYAYPDKNSVLNHTAVPVDEEVWLTRDDVARGDDTVVKRALTWITSLAYAHRAAVATPYVRAAVDSLTATAVLTNPNGHSVSTSLTMSNSAGVVLDSAVLVNDGLHGDGLPGDSIWGARVRRPSVEDFYTINLQTSDNTIGSSRVLPRATFFTTAGPVVCAADTTDKIPVWGQTIRFKFRLHNHGNTAEVKDLTVRVRPLDTSAVCANTVLQYPSILPGQSSYGSSVQMIGFSKWCTGARDIPLELTLSNRGMEFWRDTFSVRVTDPLGVPETGKIPTAFALKQNYPNPFNPRTTIKYELPRSSTVTLAAFDLLGREVSVVVNEVLNAGYHEVTFDASGLSSGVYIYRLHAGDFVSTKKMLILR